MVTISTPATAKLAMLRTFCSRTATGACTTWSSTQKIGGLERKC
jgi:hypothetical protein